LNCNVTFQTKEVLAEFVNSAILETPMLDNLRTALTVLAATARFKHCLQVVSMLLRFNS
jgi:hypothetical protein